MPGEKTEKATGKKRFDERKKGNVFMSKDVVSLVSLLVGFYGLQFLFPMMYRHIRTYLLKYMDNAGNIATLSADEVPSIGMELLITIAIVVLPILGIMFLIDILSTGVQTKFLFTSENLKPNFGKLNPIKGIKNLFSLKSVVELIKNILKTCILVYLIYNLVKGNLIGIAKTIDMDIKDSAAFMLDAVMKMLFQIVLAFIAVSGLDFFYQRWDYERQIKMTKQEIKDEYKEMEGDPKIKGKIREMQRQRAQSRMMQAVPDADVIIRNPTHYAVALRYNLDKDNAPVMIAKGKDLIALRIVEVGKENGIYIVENKPLARAIYAATSLGSEIPAEHYGAVAEILVYVFKLNHKTIT